MMTYLDTLLKDWHAKKPLNLPTLGLYHYFLCGLLMLTSAASLAEESYTEKFYDSDYRYLELAHQRLNDLTQRHYGASLQGQKDRDLRLLQRLLNDRIVTQQDSRSLQDMGVVIGQFLQQQLRLNWVRYYDEKARRSRALQIDGSKDHLLFPITMISRRAEAGIHVDIARVYQKAENIVAQRRLQPSS